MPRWRAGNSIFQPLEIDLLRICLRVGGWYDSFVTQEHTVVLEKIMASVPWNVEWVAEWIPGMEARIDQFVVDTDEVDDELTELFIEEIRRLTGELQAGAGQGDVEMVRMAAHSIKGMGGTMGLPEISVLGQEIENMVKEERLPDAKSLINALTHWIATLG